ncbi:hypothetical protein BB561_002006 [Smittium simulii]|uniref:MI domain-containing protein n=1 Tax=Smittium simulii TaxID=133385 RepID=A0A2T9YS35_9FUNG|nr:hypothetical protein BB561_002006 [Smittium simulii]
MSSPLQRAEPSYNVDQTTVSLTNLNKKKSDSQSSCSDDDSQKPEAIYSDSDRSKSSTNHKDHHLKKSQTREKLKRSRPSKERSKTPSRSRTSGHSHQRDAYNYDSSEYTDSKSEKYRKRSKERCRNLTRTRRPHSPKDVHINGRRDFISEKKRDSKILSRNLISTTSGRYFPPAKLREIEAQNAALGISSSSQTENDKSKQRAEWEKLKKKIKGMINRVNVSNIKTIVQDMFGCNLIRGRGIFCRAITRAQVQSPVFTPIYAALTSVINTRLPLVGELLVSRLIIQFRKAYQRNDKARCLATTTFLAHLTNQRVLHEILAFQVLQLLLENPTDDSVEVAVGFLKEVGSFLSYLAPRVLNAVIETFRSILHDAEIDKRVQYMIEVLLQVRREGFKDNVMIPKDLDLVEEADQIVHEISLDDENINVHDELDVFNYDNQYIENEEKYNSIKNEILGDSDVSSQDSQESSSGESDSESENGEKVDLNDKNKNLNSKDNENAIKDLTETELLNLRKTIYLTLMSSMSFEEATHKLLKIQLPENDLIELCRMVVECCSQERAYKTFYGFVGERLCKVNSKLRLAFCEVFVECYTYIHRYETNHLRHIGNFFSHLFSSEAIPFTALSCIILTEDDTTASSRIFVKVLMQDLSKSMGLQKLDQTLHDPQVLDSTSRMFPTDSPKNIRFAINYYTSIGLGALTERLRSVLSSISQNNAAGTDSSDETTSDSEASDTSSGTSSNTDSDSDPNSSSESDSGSNNSSDSSSNSSAHSRSRYQKKSKSGYNHSPHRSTKNSDYKMSKFNHSESESRSETESSRYLRRKNSIIRTSLDRNKKYHRMPDSRSPRAYDHRSSSKHKTQYRTSPKALSIDKKDINDHKHESKNKSINEIGLSRSQNNKYGNSTEKFSDNGNQKNYISKNSNYRRKSRSRSNYSKRVYRNSSGYRSKSNHRENLESTQNKNQKTINDTHRDDLNSKKYKKRFSEKFNSSKSSHSSRSLSYEQRKKDDYKNNQRIKYRSDKDNNERAQNEKTHRILKTIPSKPLRLLPTTINNEVIYSPSQSDKNNSPINNLASKNVRSPSHSSVERVISSRSRSQTNKKTLKPTGIQNAAVLNELDYDQKHKSIKKGNDKTNNLNNEGHNIYESKDTRKHVVQTLVQNDNLNGSISKTNNLKENRSSSTPKRIDSSTAETKQKNRKNTNENDRSLNRIRNGSRNRDSSKNRNRSRNRESSKNRNRSRNRESKSLSLSSFLSLASSLSLSSSLSLASSLSLSSSLSLASSLSLSSRNRDTNKTKDYYSSASNRPYNISNKDYNVSEGYRKRYPRSRSTSSQSKKHSRYH